MFINIKNIQGEIDYLEKSMYDMNFKQKNTVSIKYRNKS